MYKTIYCISVEDDKGDIFNPQVVSMFMTTDFQKAISEFNKLYIEMKGFCMTDKTYLCDFCKFFLDGENASITVKISSEGWITGNEICYPDPTNPGQGKLLRIPF